MSFGVVGTAVAGAVAGNVVGGLFGDDPSDQLQQSNNEANALQKYIYDSDVARNQPLVNSRNRALALLENGLGTTPVESREQIRARILRDQQGQNTTTQQGALPLIQTGNNSYIAPNADLNNQAIILQKQIDQLLPIINTNSSSNFSGQARDKYAKLNAQLQNLQRQQRVDNNYQPLATLGNQQVPSNIDDLVNQEYELQQRQNANIANGSLLKDFSKADFEVDPGYEFRKTEALKALERSGAARGGALSGGALKAITQYSQDVASDEFGNAYNRYNNNRNTKYNFLSNLAQLGQVGANNLSTTGQNTANQIGNNITSTGSAIATGQLYNNQLNQRNITNGINRGIAQLGNPLSNLIPSWGINYNNTNTGSFNPAFLGAGNASYGDM